ncbi:beta family protein [Phyllobacterium sp. CCNWLW109]|uniref:beta family protein n=1 Tax=Phyllobacterium sp. CCNWLW109 TaxID=3127479 RepID=UPI003076F017
MMPIETLDYVPTLRFKSGERNALSRLNKTVSDRILPHFILTPLSEKDQEKKRHLTPDELIHLNARRIGITWPLRPALVDVRFLFDALGDLGSAAWLPTLFVQIKGANGLPIPVMTLADIEGGHYEGFKATIDKIGPDLALRLQLEDLSDVRLAIRIQNILLKLVAKPAQVIVLLDLSDASFDDKEAISEYLKDTFNRLLAIGIWRRVILQATSYPDSNPAKTNTVVMLKRNEFDIWKSFIESDPVARDLLSFGDFGADCAKFTFKSIKVKPIPHIRYSTSDSWIVARGNKQDSAATSIAAVSNMILESGKFLGSDYSWADQFIADRASSKGNPGNAITWRQVNTVHHITQVVSEIGAIKHFDVERYSNDSLGEQLSFLDADSS